MKYEIIYADPPWSYPESGSKKNSRSLAKQHYETMTTEDICNLPIRSLCSDQSVCFMWATFPRITEAIKVLEAWGFRYKTAAFVWIKKNRKAGTNFFGMGAWTRANAEVCLIGISKNTKAKQQVQVNNISQIIEAPIEKHSKKPNIVRNKIVDLLGDIPRLELFAREEYEGWDCWGNEIENSKELFE